MDLPFAEQSPQIRTQNLANYGINQMVLDGFDKEFQKSGDYYLDTTYQSNPSDNFLLPQDNLYGRSLHAPMDFNEDFFEARPKKPSRTTLHKQIDLHGFTKIGATEIVRRTILQSDPTRTLVLKLGIGKGIHSKNGNVLRAEIEGLLARMGFPPPQDIPENYGFILAVIHPSRRKNE